MTRNITIGIILVLLAAAVFLRMFTRAGMPDHSGELTVKGVSGTVEVLRDKYGVPHIIAQTEADAYFGLGYAMAQDRLFQMEFLRAAANGSLSEILGEDMLNADKFLRKIMLRPRDPAARMDRYPLEVQTMINSFIGGINQFIIEDHTLPLEFRLLVHSPLLWDEGDILALIKLQSWDLSYNYDQELIYRDIINKVGNERAMDLFPYYGPEHFKLINEDIGETADLLEQSRWLKEFVGLNGGSNNWVVSGERTSSGKPILASDPHLGGTRLPGPWYFAHLQAPGLDVAGGCFAGLPLVLIGHNRDIAWGVTNMGADIQDLFIEEVNPDNEWQYLYKNEWRDFESIPEEIRIKDDEAEDGYRIETLVIRKSIHGPVMKEEDQILALAWTGHQYHDEVLTFYQINHASNWSEFTEALSHFGSAPQNFVYADVHGDIGYYGAGRIPIRAKGAGIFPVPGWTGEYDWVDVIPFEEMPQLHNPEEGFIATANAEPAGREYVYPMPGVYAPDYRTRRIRELLSQQPGTSLDEQMANQLDETSLLAGKVIPHILPILEDDQLSAMLKAWDHDMAKDSPKAALYHEIVDEFLRLLWVDDLGEELAGEYLDTWYISLNRWVALLADPENSWFDRLDTDEVEDRDELLRLAVSEATTNLKERFGSDDPSNWTWGAMHDIEWHHPFESQGGLIKRFFNYGPFPFGGDGETINRATYDFNNRYHTVMSASMRLLVDLADTGSSLLANCSGQVGVPKHPHYYDLIDAWLAGEYLEMELDRDELPGPVSTLVLKSR